MCSCSLVLSDVSPTNRYTIIAPLALVLAACALKEIEEDLERRNSDKELNSRSTKVLLADGSFQVRRWEQLVVGEVVRLNRTISSLRI